MNSTELSGLVWSKSSRSSNGDCVEVARLTGGQVGVRDSKAANGPVLVFTARDWRSFLGEVKEGDFDL
jgi:hypothetical protein